MQTLRFPVKRRDHFMFPDAMFRTKARPTHGGLDFTPVVVGQPEPMQAVEEGRVLISSYVAAGAGNNIMILGARTGIRWWYGHASKRAVVAGDRVALGQHIGTTGNTGNVKGSGGLLPGCHLHLEAHFPSINVEVDPWQWLWDAPDVDGETFPLAPTREKALLLYPQIPRTKASNELEDFMSALTPEEQRRLLKNSDDIAKALTVPGQVYGWLPAINTKVDGLLTELAAVRGLSQEARDALVKPVGGFKPIDVIRTHAVEAVNLLRKGAAEGGVDIDEAVLAGLVLDALGQAIIARKEI